MRKTMIRAWEIYRTLEGDHTAKLSMAMKQSHKENKKLDAEEIQKRLQAQGLRVVRWTKGNHDRLYVKGFHYSKEYYIDLVNMIAKGNRPGTASDIEEHLEKAEIRLDIAV